MKVVFFFLAIISYVIAIHICHRLKKDYCASGWGCAICVEKCRSDAQCPGDSHCSGAECISFKRRFFKNVNETAVKALRLIADDDVPVKCTENSDCSGFETCQAGTCGRIISTTFRNATEDYKCNGICVDGPQRPPHDCFVNLPPCTNDSECLFNWFCVDGKCQRMGPYVEPN